MIFFIITGIAYIMVIFTIYYMGYKDGKEKAAEAYDDLLDAYRQYYKAVQPIIKKANEEANHGRTM